MLKSDYIREEHEKTLLINGYICIKEENGIQTWADVQEDGWDIQHLAYQYPYYADELNMLSPSDASNSGAIYFIVKNHKGTTIVAQAIAASRSGDPL